MLYTNQNLTVKFKYRAFFIATNQNTEHQMAKNTEKLFSEKCYPCFLIVQNLGRFPLNVRAVSAKIKLPKKKYL